MDIRAKVRHWQHHVRQSARVIGRGRLLRTGFLILILFMVFVPVFQQIAIQKSYGLDPETLRVVGNANQNLVKKFSYDAGRGIWQFNKDGTGAKAKANNLPGDVMRQLQTQVGGGGKQDTSLYSVDLASDPGQGITYYDNNTTLSFTMTPEFKPRTGREQQGRIVYPFGDGGKLVYTAMTNGMKEDLVLDHNIGDQLTFSYKLKLPAELEARLNNDGSLGIYSANLSLYSATSTSDSIAVSNMISQRKSADKNHLLFAIPAPRIIDANGQSAAAMSRFQYSALTNTLTVETSGLNSVKYPLSIDPSVVITSTSDFQTNGNNEGMISYNTSGEIDRDNFTGGSVGSFSSTSSLAHTTELSSLVAYNGYMYALGGTQRSSGSEWSDVYYAAINSGTGALGSWTSTTSLPDTWRPGNGTVAYNGYIYITGGRKGVSANSTDNVIYAPINSDGTLGSWTSTTNLPAKRDGIAAVAYGNYLYVTGGSLTVGASCGGTGDCQNTVYYAPFKGDGSVGSWNTTTAFTTVRAMHNAVTYNGYMYIIGGANTGFLNDVQYAAINSDGTLGNWTATSSFTTARYGMAGFAYNGYIYLEAGGYGTLYNDVQYAQINADGTLGPWTTDDTTFTNTRTFVGGTAYNGYIYVAFGYCNSTCDYSDVQYAKIDPIGTSTASSTITAAPAARNGACSVTYNGYIYFMGGSDNTSTYYNNTYYTTVNATTGAIGGSWTGTNAMNTAASFAACGIWNGKVYIMGGLTTGNGAISTVQYATLNTNGTLSTWSTTTSLPQTSGNHTGTIYNGYAYVVANTSGGGNGAATGVFYAPITSSGTITSGTWSTTSVLGTATNFSQMVAYAGNMYVVGGGQSGTNYNIVQLATINTNGTLGSWTTTSTMNVNRAYLAVAVINGYMYAVGGDTGSSTDVSSVEFAAVNSDGTLGSWQTTTSLSSTRAREAFAQYGDFIYLLAGRTGGSAATTSYRLSVNSGGSNLASSWSTNSPSLSGPYSSGWAYGAAATYQGYIYTAGGYNPSGTLSAVNYAPINTDGTLGSWTATNSLNVVRQSFGLVVYNNYIYAIGGQGSSTSTLYNDYEYAQLSPSGGLATSWTRVTSGGFTDARMSFAIATYGGYVYIYGGKKTGSVELNDVNYAAFNTDGTLGSWTNVANSFTGVRRDLRGFAYNGYLYVVGGITGSTYYSDIQYIALNTNGSLSGSWLPAGSLPLPRVAFDLTVSNGYLYVFGGYNNIGGLATLISAEIPKNGNVDNWQTINSFSSARNSSGYAVYNGILYLLGGYTGAPTYFTDIQTTHLYASARKAIYSKLIDLGTTGYVSSISYNGNLPNSLKAIAYRVSDGAGNFGSLQLADNVSVPTDKCQAAISRYIWIQVTLDDSTGNGIMPDPASSEAAITDITVNYAGAHPPPDLRLYGGKFFQDQALQPLDTCKP